MTSARLLVLCLLACGLTPVATAAQDVPTVFVHGIFSGSDAWRATSQRLASTLQIAPHVPDLPSTSVLETQTAALDGALGGLPANTIAIGHSQGGLITRQWSRSKALRGILTLGTPHTGSQLTARGLDLINFNYMVYNLAGLAIGTSSAPDFAWLVAAGLQAYLSNIQWLSWNTAAAITSSVAVAGYVPVATQLVPGSSFLNSLNTFGNMAREDAAIAKRVGLVYTAADYWRAGAAVGLAPQRREEVWAIIQISPPVLDWVAAWLETNFPATHFLARSFAIRMRQLAAVMRDMDPQWCYAVTGDRSCSVPHDGIVSSTNQLYPGPGAMNFAVYGPAHTQETRQSDGVISVGAHGTDGGRRAGGRATTARQWRRQRRRPHPHRRPAPLSRSAGGLRRRPRRLALPVRRQPRALWQRRRRVVGRRYLGAQRRTGGDADRRQFRDLRRRRYPDLGHRHPRPRRLPAGRW